MLRIKKYHEKIVTLTIKYVKIEYSTINCVIQIGICYHFGNKKKKKIKLVSKRILVISLSQKV